MTWRNPNEPHLSETDSYPCSYKANRSEFGRRAARLLVDCRFFVRLYHPWISHRHAMDLAVDRDRLVDDFRD